MAMSKEQGEQATPERWSAKAKTEVAAQLTHPHILPLYDSGDADGFLYYVMPYIEGQSLREKLANEGELPIAEAVKILREVVDMVAFQDPPSVPTSLIELSTQIILHKFNSPAWLKHVQKANSALDALTPAKLASLGPGEAYVWSSKATDDAFTRGAVKVRCCPRVTLHGGGTKTAVAPRNE